MGMFDTIIGELECPECREVLEREIQTKRGRCLMETYHIGDTIEPFYFGDYWFEEEWYCENCQKKATEKDGNAKRGWHKAYVHCINGLVIGISASGTGVQKLPDWDLIHKISRERKNYRSVLLKIDDRINNFTSGKEKGTHFLFDTDPKTADELFQSIRCDIRGVLRGEPPGLF
jgi:hypothetical protein